MLGVDNQSINPSLMFLDLSTLFKSTKIHVVGWPRVAPHMADFMGPPTGDVISKIYLGNSSISLVLHKYTSSINSWFTDFHKPTESLSTPGCRIPSDCPPSSHVSSYRLTPSANPKPLTVSTDLIIKNTACTTINTVEIAAMTSWSLPRKVKKEKGPLHHWRTF